MRLPDLIEIVPLDKPVRAEITVPGSKSITNRALILAALGEGETTLQGALWSEDTQVMVEALQRLGFEVQVGPDPQEVCNRTIRVKGLGGRIPRAGTAEEPLEIFVGNAGTAARFLAVLVCLGPGVYRLDGVPRMRERPQAELFAALWELGYEVQPERDNQRLPAKIRGVPPPRLRPGPDRGHPRSGLPARACSVSIEASSQFASALLLCAPTAGWTVKVIGQNADESPYVAMTSKLLEVFPKQGGVFQIEPDASSGSYFIAAERLIPRPEPLEYAPELGVAVPTVELEPVRVLHWPESGWQVDQKFEEVLRSCTGFDLGLGLKSKGPVPQNITPEELKSIMPGELELYLTQPPFRCEISRARDLGDSIMTAIVLAPFSLTPVRFTDLGRLRVQECERVAALRSELTRCGGKVIEEGDTLTVYPSELHGAEIETYNDHRMAMCFAIPGLKIAGIKLKNPSCVKKTFPNFFQKLAAPPPTGLGATIRDGHSGRELAFAELFAA